MFKFHHGQVPDSISSIFKLNIDVHSYNTRRNLHCAPLEEIMSSYITHFLFNLCIFGTKYLDVLALKYLFLNLGRFLNVYSVSPIVDGTEYIKLSFTLYIYYYSITYFIPLILHYSNNYVSHFICVS